MDPFGGRDPCRGFVMISAIMDSLGRYTSLMTFLTSRLYAKSIRFGCVWRVSMWVSSVNEIIIYLNPRRHNIATVYRTSKLIYIGITKKFQDENGKGKECAES